jgi:hypothetical protein
MREVWAHKTSLTLPLFYIEVPVPSQESEWSCIFYKGISILSIIMIFYKGIYFVYYYDFL